MFDLDKILTAERRRESDRFTSDKRTEHNRDYDRIIFSPYFRRLQDKAQVFPMDKDDFVRTRLTHSLEVATLGRSFGYDVPKTLKEKGNNDLNDENALAFMNILASSCLLHDIGNPPFGHFGEESIKTWFSDFFKNNGDSLGLNEQQKNDFLIFEGNAQTLRVITFNDYISDEFGLNLTYATLAASIKYTCNSTEIDNNKGKAYKKFGHFFSENEIFAEIQEKTGLNNQRHPLVYLMEAADDIAYSIIDIEDALRKGVVNHDCFLNHLHTKLVGDKYSKLVKEYEENMIKFKGEWERANSIATNKFRIKVIGTMFRDCVDAFVLNYESIMNGEFKTSLIEVSNSNKLQETLTTFARTYVYNNKEILMLESLGYKVIHGLLEIFIPAVLSDKNGTVKTYHGKINEILSPALRALYNKFSIKKEGNLTYYKLLLVTDYISMMTDSYALHLYRRLSGIKL